MELEGYPDRLSPPAIKLANPSNLKKKTGVAIYNPTTTFKLDYLSKLNILPSKTLT
jgi:hypothetical protein